MLSISQRITQEHNQADALASAALVGLIVLQIVTNRLVESHTGAAIVLR